MPKKEHTPVDLFTVGRGAAAELFEDALVKVLENVADPNTEWKPKRTIRLEVSIAPNEDRNVGEVNVSCSTKLCGLVGQATIVYIGRGQGGRLMAVEQPTQETMFPRPEGAVVNFQGQKDEDK